MAKICKKCSADFEIRSKDQEYYQKMDVPEPTFCPECRLQRRMSMLNEMHLYRRKCDFSGKEIMSTFHPDCQNTVYEQEVWWTDKWDPLKYGRDYDFSRGFFEQFRELMVEAPMPALQTAFAFDENCEFTNNSGKNKNCYLIFDSDENRDSYYSYSINKCDSTMDCYRVRESQLCYECLDCNKCYNSWFLQDCENCSDSIFLKNCIGCSNCIMCSNLKNKQYYVNNKQVTKEEFEAQKKKCMSAANVGAAQEFFDQWKLSYPQKYVHELQSENFIGDYLTHCKESYYCFDSADLWDCAYCYQAFASAKDSMDVYQGGDGVERFYECSVAGYNSFNLKFCFTCFSECSDMTYCNYCFSCKNCFGCSGLRHKNFCILNKQYTEAQYRELLPRIIEHMKSSGEYGEFFPMNISNFAYNETNAMDAFPMTKEEVLAAGLRWREDDPKEFKAQSYFVPDLISDVGEEVLNEVLSCETCQRNYKIMKGEYYLLKRLGLPLSKKCFFCRNEIRRAKRNPKKIFDRKCMQCNADVKTTYAPDRAEVIYCGKCYVESLV